MAEIHTSKQYYQGRLGLQQRVLPAYREAFFDMLDSACQGGLSVFAGQPLPDEQINTIDHLDSAYFIPARNWHIFSMGSPFYQCLQFGLVNWLESWQPDALVVEANPRCRNTLRAVRWMHARARPVLGWGLGAPPVSAVLSGWRQKGRRYFLSSLDGLIAYSQRGAQQYLSMGIPEDRIYVSPNAASPKPVTPPPNRPQSFDGQPKILFVGRLQERKRIDLLLQACAALPQPLQPQVWIIGEGPARATFKEIADRVYPRAEFLGAHYGSELDTLFDAADLFVLPGSGGLAVQQAMAHALPVMVAEGDGTQDDLVRPENGWCIPPDDLPALTETLQFALADASRLRSMGLASYRIVTQEINLEAMVAVFIQALNETTRLGNI